MTIKIHEQDYISLTNMSKEYDGGLTIERWLSSKETLEFLGIWESIHNPDFKSVEFDRFKNEAGLNRFKLSPREWVEATNAIGIQSKSGRYGGTYAHRDIAVEFNAWLSPEFRLYLIKEFQRSKE